MVLTFDEIPGDSDSQRSGDILRMFDLGIDDYLKWMLLPLGKNILQKLVAAQIREQQLHHHNIRPLLSEHGPGRSGIRSKTQRNAVPKKILEIMIIVFVRFNI